ncbi:MAG TPA: hypothetical protein VK212_06575 [Lentimicrobium sp.]|nr:hypothetical protein [Lentimicrobium sp.]
MKTISIIGIICLLITTSLSAADSELNRLILERNQQNKRLQYLSDSIIPGRMTRLYLLNDQMQKILQIDDSILRHTESLINSESALNDSLRAEEQRAAKLSLDYEQLVIRSRNDSRMILIMKTSTGVLILAVLVLLYLLLYRRKSQKNYDMEAEIDSLVKENNALQSQVSNFQVREERIKAEIDKEVELKTTTLKSEIDKEVELKTADLQAQLNEANERNHSILNKIDKLIRDLSSVN